MIKRTVITLLFIVIVLGYGVSLNADYNSTVYTPNSTAVTVRVMTWELPPFEIISLNNLATSQYPNATLLRSSSRKYNCHSYAWYSQSSSNNRWMNDPSSYWEDGSYQQVYWAYSPIPPYVNSKVYYPCGNHSAIVYSSMLFNSKWGLGPLMRHTPSYCPYNYSSLQYYFIY